MSGHPADLILATVVDDDYLPGALVMLDSFVRHHHGFHGRIVVIHDESLGLSARRALGETFDRVEFHPVRPELREKIRLLTEAVPSLTERARRFYSLDAFALPGDGPVLFCDADLLFRRTIDPFLTHNASLTAVSDRAALTGRYHGQTAATAFKNAPSRFNSGLMLIPAACRTADTDDALQGLLAPDCWREVRTGHTDQRVLNEHFAGRVALQDNTFNYLLHCREELERDYQLPLNAAAVWHFSNSIKPWAFAKFASCAEPAAYDPAVQREWEGAFATAMARRAERTAKHKAIPVLHGAKHDLPKLIQSHLFIISPNNSGSTWVKNILATSRHTWNLAREGQHTFGATGPNTIDTDTTLTWAAQPDTLALFTNPAAFDWAVTKRAWYFQATSRSPNASVFVEKSPPYLTQVAGLQAAFTNARFIFLVRNPYAVAESILRRVTSRHPDRATAIAMTAQHLLTCLKIQRENLRKYGAGNLFVTYEHLCREPDAFVRNLQTLVPVIDDLDPHRTIDVKGMYFEPLRDMNAQQIARLTDEDRRLLAGHFSLEAGLLASFGYAVEPPPN